MNINKICGIPCELQHLPTQLVVDTHSLLLTGLHELPIICWENKIAQKTTLRFFKRQKIAGLSRLATLNVAPRTLHVHVRLCMCSLISQYRSAVTVTIAIVQVRFISR